LEFLGAHTHAFFELTMGTSQRLRRRPCRRQVVDDLGKAETPVRAEWCGDDLRVEQGSVLTASIAFEHRSSVDARLLEYGAREACALILDGVQFVDTPADNRFGVVAKHALRAGVPRLDATIRTEREYGVVCRAINQQTQTPFAHQHRRLCLTQTGDVDKRQHHPFDAIVDRAIRQDTHEIQTLVAAANFPLDRPEMRKDMSRISGHAFIVDAARNV
jgi:hypothetical protein